MGLKQIAHYGLMTFLACSLTLGSISWAQVPETSTRLTLESFIHTLDSDVKMREDSLVTFSDGSQYVLIRPEEPASPEQLSVLKRLPEGKQPADIIVFNEGSYLLRILTLASGQKTFPVLPEIPDELKTGMLSQNLAFPEGFFLPTQWKALTGNLLVNPAATAEPAKTIVPLAVFSSDPDRLTIWDPATAEVRREITVPCKPSALITAADGKTLWMGCSTEKKLYGYALDEGQNAEITLKEPVLSMALDNRQNRLFISHPDSRHLDILDTKTRALLPELNLPYIVGNLVVSPMRSKLFTTVTSSQKKVHGKDEPVMHTALGRFFRHPSRLDEMAAEAAEAAGPQREPALQIVNTATMTLERVSPALDGVNQIYNQDEKLLWTYSPQAKALQAFDMRWQEFSEPLPVDEAPADFASDGTWLYVLFPQQNVLARLNTKTMMWGAPIALEPGSVPQSLVYDPGDNQALVLANSPNGIQVINLNRGEWVGTQQTNFAGLGELVRLGEMGLSANEQVRIKFQNGRVLRQTVQGLQWEKWLSGPHAQQSSQNQQAPEETLSVP